MFLLCLIFFSLFFSTTHAFLLLPNLYPLLFFLFFFFLLHTETVFEGFEINPSAALSLSLNSARSLHQSAKGSALQTKTDSQVSFCVFSSANCFSFFCFVKLLLYFSLWIISMYMCFLALTYMIYVIVVLVGFFVFLVLCQRSWSVFMSVRRLSMKLLNTNMIYYLAYYMLPFATNNNILYNLFFW